MSQEIRTEMNSIVGLTYLVEESKNGGIDINYGSQVYGACTRLIKLFEDFFDTEIALKDSSRIKLHRHNLRELSDNIFSEFKEYLEKHCKIRLIQISDTTKNDEIEVLLDTTRISRILHYLFQNAVRNNDRIRYIKTGTRFKDNRITFFALDPLTDYDFCKDYFTEGSNDYSAIKNHNPGTAINYTLAIKNVRLLSGRIWIERYESTGTGFYISIPVKSYYKQTCLL